MNSMKGVSQHPIRSFACTLFETPREKALSLIGGNCRGLNINRSEDWDQIDRDMDKDYEDYCHGEPGHENDNCDHNESFTFDADGNITDWGWGTYGDSNGSNHEMGREEWEKWKEDHDPCENPYYHN